MTPTPEGQLTSSEIWVPEQEEEKQDVVQTTDKTTDSDSK